MESNSIRIAKNTLFMYVRMILVLVIALYSSRVVLQNLGVEDFGTYNLVGSIVAMVSMLRPTFASAIQRFMNFEMGRKRYDRIQLVFSMSIIINVFFSVAFIIIAELIGLWFFEYKINVSPERIIAAKIVFQFSVLSSIISIMTTPFDALLVAYEQFNFYAIISVVDSILRLCCALVIAILPGDNLINYGALILIVAILNRLANGIYCGRHYRESHFIKVWDKSLFKELISFSGWQILGFSSWTLCQNGLNLVFNVFGGTVVNAARGVSQQVYSAISQFMNNLITVITPYSIKAYAEGYTEGVDKMFYFSTKILFVGGYCLAIPIIILAPQILEIWLKNVPDYTIGFVQITMVWSIVHSVHQPIDTLLKAVGRIKEYQITEFVLGIMPLLASIFLLSKGLSFYLALGTIIVFDLANLAAILIISNRIAKLNIRVYSQKIIMPSIAPIIAAILLYYIVFQLTSLSTVFICFIVAVFEVVMILYSFLFLLDKVERQIVKSIICKHSKKSI